MISPLTIHCLLHGFARLCSSDAIPLLADIQRYELNSSMQFSNCFAKALHLSSHYGGPYQHLGTSCPSHTSLEHLRAVLMCGYAPAMEPDVKSFQRQRHCVWLD